MSDDVLAQSHFQQRGFVQVHLAVLWECGLNAAAIYGFLERWVWIGSRTGKGAFPSHETLSQQCGLSPRTVVTALQELRDKGWITWERTGMSNRYVLTDKIGRSANFADHGQGEGSDDLQMTQNRSANFADEVERESKSITPLSPTVTSPLKGSKHPMTAEWQPSDDDVKYAVEWGIAEEFIPEVVEDFVGYWLERPREKRPGWSRTFKARVRDVSHQYQRRARVARSPNGVIPKNRAEEIMAAAARVQARHDERDGNRANGDRHRIGVRSEDEASGYAAGTVSGGVGGDPSGHTVDAVWRERS